MQFALRYHAALSAWHSWLPVLMPGAQCRIANRHAVAITIDDGPTIKGTASLLQAFSRANLRGTFFLTGKKAEQSPALVRDIAALGHDIASHGYSHDDMFFASARYLSNDLLRSLDVIEHCSGIRPRCYRPPYGRINPFHLSIPEKLGCVLVLWSRMPRDFDSKQSGISLLRNLSVVRGGDIVVLHDNLSTVGRLPELVNALSQRLNEKGLIAVRLTDEKGSL